MPKSTKNIGKNKFLILGIAVLILSLSLGYAYLDEAMDVFEELFPSSSGPYAPPICMVYASSSVNFPPSPVDPPLPPKNDKPYEEPNHVCVDFANEFCQATRDVEAIKKCWVLLFDSHAANLFRFTDGDGKSWVCIVEPQHQNDYYCMPQDEWDKKTKEEKDEWVKKKVCLEYYNFTEEKCNKSVYFIPLCQDTIGTVCSEPGKIAGCLADNSRKTTPIQCKCVFVHGARVCTWQQKSTTVPI